LQNDIEKNPEKYEWNISEVFDEKVEQRHTSKIKDMNDDDKEEYNNTQTYIDSIRNDWQKLEKLSRELDWLLTEKVIDGLGTTAKDKIDTLEEKFKNKEISYEKYINEVNTTLKDAWAEQKQKEMEIVYIDNMMWWYSLVSNISKEDLIATYEKKWLAYTEQAIANVMNISTKELKGLVWKKTKKNAEYFKDKYNVDIDIANKQKYTQIDANIAGIDWIFSKAWYLLDEDETDNIQKAAYDIETINALPVWRQDDANNIITDSNLNILESVKWGAMLSERWWNKEDWGEMYKRYINVLNSDVYKNYQATILELLW